MLEIRVYFARL